MMKIVLLLSLVVAVYSFPMDAKSKVNNIKRNVLKALNFNLDGCLNVVVNTLLVNHTDLGFMGICGHLITPEKAHISKRSRYDTFTKYDLDGNDRLDKLEMAYFFYNLGFDVEWAHNFAEEALRLADVDVDNTITRWEWERESHDAEKKPLENLYY